MALPSNPLHRRLALAAAGAVVLAGGAGLAYAGTVGSSPTPVVESGYATVAEGETGPGRATDDQDCPERSGGGAAPEESAPSESAPSESAASESAPEGSGAQEESDI